jgi:glycosyltransferase involved in cell wall biosynthesis
VAARLAEEGINLFGITARQSGTTESLLGFIHHLRLGRIPFLLVKTEFLPDDPELASDAARNVALEGLLTARPAGFMAQLFYKAGPVFSEQDSVAVQVDPRCSRIAFQLPRSLPPLRELRLDPANVPVRIALNGISVKTADGRLEPVSRFTTNADRVDGRDLTFLSNDSQIVFSLERPEVLRSVVAEARFVSSPDDGAETKAPSWRPNRFPLNLFFLNPGDAVRFLSHARALGEEKASAAVVWWEFETGLDTRSEAYQELDSFVVFSELVRSALVGGGISPERVRKLLFPFVPPPPRPELRRTARARLGFSDDDFVFVFHFDFMSGFERKNPEGLLRAFAEAEFRDGKTKLLLKTIRGASAPRQLSRLRTTIAALGLGRSVRIDDGVVDRATMWATIDASDCYVSLHRGEGLGLGMLEAMWLGKPVIATRHGGNLEFMSEENAFLVDAAMVPAADDHPAYRDVVSWAEPRIDQAASWMREIRESPHAAQRRARRAAEDVRAQFHPERVAQSIRSLLRDLPGWPRPATTRVP